MLGILRILRVGPRGVFFRPHPVIRDYRKHGRYMKDFGKRSRRCDYDVGERIKPYKTAELGIILGVIIGAVALAAKRYFAVNRLKMRPSS